MSSSTGQRERELLTEVLGYEVTTSLIGKGSYSKVVYGIDKISKKKVAVKMVDLKYHRNYYERELAALSSVPRHKSIVQLITHFEDWENQIGYLIEEYIRAATLEDYVREKTQKVGLKEKEALGIFEQLLEAVNHVHIRSFTHHDLKPENVLYDPLTDRIRLIDFGLALKMDEDDYVDHCAGSPLYMAPEVLHNTGSHNAIKSDVWSLGIFLFYLLVGDTPYLSVETVEDLITLVDTRKFYNPYFLSQEAMTLINSMLRENPSERPSVGQVLKHVRNLRKKSSSTNSKIASFTNFAFAAVSQA